MLPGCHKRKNTDYMGMQTKQPNRYNNHRTGAKGVFKNVPENILVVLDEAYYEYVQNSNYPRSVELLNEYDNIIVLQDFLQDLWPGRSQGRIRQLPMKI